MDHRVAARMRATVMGPWLNEAMKGEMEEEEKIRIHVSEMLAFTVVHGLRSCSRRKVERKAATTKW